MPRPSMKKIRSEEILAAYAKCIIRFGFEGATQDKIASEANVKRPILRHYLGNRRQMIEALIDYVDIQIEKDLELLKESLPDKRRVGALIDILFDQEHAADDDAGMMMQALVSAAYSYPELNSKTLNWTNGYIKIVKDEIVQEYPNISDERAFQIAFGIVALHFNIDYFSQISIPDTWWAASNNAACTLVRSIESN